MKEYTVNHNDLKTLRVSEFAENEPDLTPEAFKLLENDILENGLLNPVVVYNSEIYDGRHRFEIVKKSNYDLKVIEVATLGEAKILAISGNHHRRHLTKPQYAIMAIKEYIAGGEVIPLDKSRYVLNKFVSLSYVKNTHKIYKHNKLWIDEIFNGIKTFEEVLSETNKELEKKKKEKAASEGKEPKESPIVKRTKEFFTKNNIDKSVENEVEEISKKEKFGKTDLLKEYLFMKYKLIDIIKESGAKIDLDEKLKAIKDESAAAIKKESDENNTNNSDTSNNEQNTDTPL